MCIFLSCFFSEQAQNSLGGHSGQFSLHFSHQGYRWFSIFRDRRIMGFHLSTIPGTSGREIKRKLEHLVEVRPTRPIRTSFEIIDYFKCEILNKFCKLRGQYIKKIRTLRQLTSFHHKSAQKRRKFSRTYVKWHGLAPSQHSRVNKSFAPYLVHRFINCRGTPHVCLACAAACRGTIMFKIVCIKITAMWP